MNQQLVVGVLYPLLFVSRFNHRREQPPAERRVVAELTQTI